MKFKKLWLSLVAVAFVVTFTSTVHAQFKLQGDPKIAMVYFAVKNDGGWTQAIDEARQRLEGQLNVKIPFTEKVPEVASQIVKPSLSSGIHFASGTRTPAVVPFHVKITSFLKFTLLRSGSFP